MKAVEILLVEDDVDDVELTQAALARERVLVNLRVVGDGVDAMAYLRREDPFIEVAEPDLVLLDLNLPRMSGQEVLVEMKGDDELKHIPVVILTTSEDERDVLESYQNHANCYVTKPLGLEEFGEIVRSIEGFWLSVVRLPPKG